MGTIKTLLWKTNNKNNNNRSKCELPFIEFVKVNLKKQNKKKQPCLQKFGNSIILRNGIHLFKPIYKFQIEIKNVVLKKYTLILWHTKLKL